MANWRTCLRCFSPRHLGLAAFGMAALALVIAYVAEYGFGLRPCEMCYWQRIPFAVALVLGLVAWLLPAISRPLVWLCVLTFAASTGLAVFHAGVEWEWWQGPGGCAVNFTPDMTPEEVLRHIRQAASVSCTDAAVRVLGLSMAGWNALYSLGCTVVLLLGKLQTKEST